mmetsp:Transcript_16548/g.33273  ORF Transcript_16548/g.33273 Transcript_16548/m.33273 type:complete len:212 (-) Transcript_16548:410-1045(-)
MLLSERALRPRHDLRRHLRRLRPSARAVRDGLPVVVALAPAFTAADRASPGRARLVAQPATALAAASLEQRGLCRPGRLGALAAHRLLPPRRRLVDLPAEARASAAGREPAAPGQGAAGCTHGKAGRHPAAEQEHGAGRGRGEAEWVDGADHDAPSHVWRQHAGGGLRCTASHAGAAPEPAAAKVRRILPRAPARRRGAGRLRLEAPARCE